MECGFSGAPDLANLQAQSSRPVQRPGGILGWIGAGWYGMQGSGPGTAETRAAVGAFLRYNSILEVPLNRTFVRAITLTTIVALAACQGSGMGGGAIPAGPGGPPAQGAQAPSSMPAGQSDLSDGSDQSAGAAATPSGLVGSTASDGVIPITSANAVNRVCAPARQPGEKTCFALERRDLR